MRTTIHINNATLAELRKRASATGKPFRQTVEETLQIGLAHSSLPPAGDIQLKTFPVGIKPAYRGTSLNQLYDQLESDRHLNVAES